MSEQDEPVYRPWGIVDDPLFWARTEEPEESGPPETGVAEESETDGDGEASVPSAWIAEGLVAVQAAAAADLAQAVDLCRALDARVTDAFGETHVETLKVREVRAYLALLSGFHDPAVTWYAHVVALHAAVHGRGHPETDLAVGRAYSMWRSLPAAEAVRLAAPLLDAFASVQGAGEKAVARMHVHLPRLRETTDELVTG
ncbi:hypothetical protein ACIRP0_31445 [Streptomyces sp. NPDC101733]|uniref:hypothetical protein n=1 Tax=unclassified Streptomyces TaxID=2593676 RepID=UPI003802D067